MIKSDPFTGDIMFGIMFTDQKLGLSPRCPKTSAQLCTGVAQPWNLIYEQIMFSLMEKASTQLLTPCFW